MDRVPIYFGIFFAIVGFFISLVFSLLSKNPVMAIIINILISIIVSFVLGIIVFYILKQKVPEILEIFNNSFKNTMDSTEEEYNFDTGEEGWTDNFENSESFTKNEAEEKLFTGDNDVRESVSEEKLNKKNKHFGDHILVDKIKIKNEPKLMAEAIRTMLSKDE